MNGSKFIASWSGGKDSAYAFYLACANDARPVGLLTMLDESGERSRSHRLSTDLLHAQAKRLSLPLFIGSATWAEYETVFINRLIEARDQRQATAVVFGDINIDAHRQWCERICNRPDVGMRPIFPLWGQERRTVVMDMLSCGQQAMIVSCHEKLGKPFLGRMIDEQALQDIKARGIDICGENGEFHTVVLNSPQFSSLIRVTPGACLEKKIMPDVPTSESYWFLDLVYQP